MKNEKNILIIMMSILVLVWGFDYILAKFALAHLAPLELLFFKYMVAFVLVLIIKLKTEGAGLLKVRDIPVYIVSVMFGEIIYYYSEYTAMSYLPVSIIAIIVAFVPALSVITERVLFKKKTSLKIILGIVACVFGVSLIIGVDFEMLVHGKIIGYLLAFACVFSWNAYNFITVSIHKRYKTATLTLNQIICTLILLAPYVIHNVPSLPAPTVALALQILFLGVFNSGLGFLIVVRALHVLGPTTTSLFSNFAPVATTFFGWLILKETISPLQLAGGVIVIAAGYIVIKEKGKMEELTGE